MPDVSQQLAIEWGKKPLLLIAGPGSGKTTVLVNRIKYLMEESCLAADRILVITFTREAARQMQDRFLLLCPKDGNRVHFATFHSAFFHMLTENLGYRQDDLMTDKMRHEFLKEILREEGLRLEDAEGIEKELSAAKNRMTKPKENYVSIYHKYEKLKRDRRKLDFDDLLSEPLRIFQEDAEKAAFWRNRFDAILVDEAQDMNLLQYSMLQALYHPGQSLFLVGDDDQSIYGFRGAEPGLLLRFPKEFQDAQVRYLSTNYRSAAGIVASSSQLINHNQNRYPKNLRAHSDAAGEIYYLACQDPDDEAEKLLRLLQEEIRTGRDPNRIAVLFRNRRQVYPLRRLMLGADLDFVYREDNNGLLDHFIHRDIEAYLMIASGSCDRKYYLRIWNRPERNLPRELLMDEKIAVDRLPSIDLHGSYRDRLQLLARQFRLLGSLSPYAAIQMILKGLGYERYLCDEAYRRGMEKEEYLEIAYRFRDSGKHFKNISDFLRTNEELRRKDAISRREQTRKKNGIRLHTFHSSKGLEFDSVMILDVCEGITPTKKAIKPEEIEEERRMFYVALTRAKKKIILSTIERDHNQTLSPSRFLREMKEEIRADPGSHQNEG